MKCRVAKARPEPDFRYCSKRNGAALCGKFHGHNQLPGTKSSRVLRAARVVGFKPALNVRGEPAVVAARIDPAAQHVYEAVDLRHARPEAIEPPAKTVNDLDRVFAIEQEELQILPQSVPG